MRLVERRVPLLAAVHLATGDDLAEGLDRDRERATASASGDKHRIAGRRVAARPPGRARRGPPRAPALLSRRAGSVANVVDPAGEGVERRHRRPLRRGEQPDAVEEVPGLATGDRLAAVVGGGELGHGRVLLAATHTPRVELVTLALVAFTGPDRTS